MKKTKENLNSIIMFILQFGIKIGMITKYKEKLIILLKGN